MRQFGVWDHIRTAMIPGLPICENASIFTSAALENVASAIMLLALGAIVATIFGQ